MVRGLLKISEREAGRPESADNHTDLPMSHSGKILNEDARRDFRLDIIL